MFQSIKLSESNLACIKIVFAAFFWGFIGLVSKILFSQNFNSFTIITFRIFIAFLGILILLLLNKIQITKVDKKDFKIILLYSLLGIFLYNFAFYSALKNLPIAIAIILTYFYPVIVLFLSSIFLKEKISKKKIISIILTSIGIIFVINPSNLESIKTIGIIFGLLSALFMASNCLIGKKLLKKYSPITITFYSFFINTFILLIIGTFTHQFQYTFNILTSTLLLILGLIITLLAFILYNSGLKQIESSKVAIITTLDIIISTLTGFIILKEKIILIQIIGIILVLSGIISLNLKNEK